MKKSATIVHGNALRIDWEEVVPKSELSFILGNSPFYGYSLQTVDLCYRPQAFTNERARI